jgi:hypothetical protein
MTQGRIVAGFAVAGMLAGCSPERESVRAPAGSPPRAGAPPVAVQPSPVLDAPPSDDEESADICAIDPDACGCAGAAPCTPAGAGKSSCSCSGKAACAGNPACGGKRACATKASCAAGTPPPAVSGTP